VLPGSPATRTRVAAGISVAVALLLVVWAWSRGAAWTAGVFVVVAAINLVPLLAREGAGTGSPEQRAYAVLADVLRGDLSAARTRTAEGRVDPAVIALLDVLDGRADGSQVRRLAFDRPDPLRRACLVVLEVSCRDWGAVARVVGAGPLPGGLASWAMGLARQAGQPAQAALVGQAALTVGGDPETAYLTARSWGAARQPERAYETLVYARSLGWDDLPAAEAEPDLAQVRQLSAWHALLRS